MDEIGHSMGKEVPTCSGFVVLLYMEPPVALRIETSLPLPTTILTPFEFGNEGIHPIFIGYKALNVLLNFIRH